jgi:hypothetical protein
MSATTTRPNGPTASPQSGDQGQSLYCLDGLTAPAKVPGRPSATGAGESARYLTGGLTRAISASRS